jgi:hypothetical protein
MSAGSKLTGLLLASLLCLPAAGQADMPTTHAPTTNTPATHTPTTHRAHKGFGHLPSALRRRLSYFDKTVRANGPFIE